MIVLHFHQRFFAAGLSFFCSLFAKFNKGVDHRFFCSLELVRFDMANDRGGKIGAFIGILGVDLF